MVFNTRIDKEYLRAQLMLRGCCEPSLNGIYSRSLPVGNDSLQTGG